MDRAAVEHWVESYERLWRTPGSEGLADLFAQHATYLPSPWARPLEGLDAIELFWEAEREGPNEDFDMSTEILAVDGDTAVVRVSVDYGRRDGGRWRNLWVLRLTEDGRCTSFEEWPFTPGQSDGH
jgi:hypothetical protein